MSPTSAGKPERHQNDGIITSQGIEMIAETEERITTIESSDNRNEEMITTNAGAPAQNDDEQATGDSSSDQPKRRSVCDVLKHS